MGMSHRIRALSPFVVALLLAGGAQAQTATNLDALRGLAPFSTLLNSDAGKAALTRNLAVTGAIQQGKSHQPTLLPFREQEQQALRDAFIPAANANDLADGLGTKLGGAYQALTTCTSTDDGTTADCPSVTPALGRLIAYAMAVAGADSNSGKYFFANGTTDGKQPISDAARSIMNQAGGTTDIYGKAYGAPAATMGVDPHGDSRPFQTEPAVVFFKGKDYFGVASGNDAYLHGPTQNLTASPAFPSGHTTYGYTEAMLLAILLPDRYAQMMARAAEYGNDRIILGAHYTMDVMAGRTLAEYDLAQLLANKPDYVGVDRGGVHIDDFRQALADARPDLVKALEKECGGTIAACARDDHSRFSLALANRVFYETTLTYGLPAVFKATVGGKADVARLAPEAGYLLTAAFPNLTLDQADAILTATEGPGGRFLDNGSAFGVYSRLDLYAASLRAAAVAPKK